MTTQLIVECIRKKSFRYTDLLAIAYDVASEKSITVDDMALTLTERKPTWVDINVRNPKDYFYFIIETEEDDDG